MDLMLKLPAAGFERLCQRVLREAGFIQVVVTGRSGDGGIELTICTWVVPFCRPALIASTMRAARTSGPALMSKIA